MGFSSTAIALLTAFISVTTVGVPRLFEAMADKNSQIEFRYLGKGGGQNGKPKTFSMTVWNGGSRTGEISKVHVHYTGQFGEPETLDFYVSGKAHVRPDAMRVIGLSMVKSSIQHLKDNPPATQFSPACEIWMDGHRFTGERYRKIVRSVSGLSEAYVVPPNFAGEIAPAVSLVEDGRISDVDCLEVLNTYL